MVIDDGRVGKPSERIIVMGLTIHDDEMVVFGGLTLFEVHQWKLQQPGQGLVVESADGADDADGRGLNPMPQESLDGEGGPDGVGVGVYGDEDLVF
jgi:hypothetical protein